VTVVFVSLSLNSGL